MSKGVSGFKWNAVAGIFRTVFLSLLLILLAHLLTVEDFGLVAILSIFTYFFSLISNLGLESSIIYSKTLIKSHLFTLFVLCISMGALISITSYILAPFVGVFYKQPQLTEFLQVLSIVVFINSFTIVSRGILQKRLDFKPLALTEVISVTIGGVIALIMAFIGNGMWSLVYMQIITSLCLAISLLYLTYKEVFASLKFYPKIIPEHLKFGLNIQFFNILNFFVQQIDVILVGKLLNTKQAGYYILSYNIAFKPANLIIQAFNNTLYPILSETKGVKKIKEIYLNYSTILIRLTLPILIFGSAFAYLLIPPILGEKWDSIIPIVLIFMGFSIIRLFGSPAGVFFKITNHPQLQWIFLILCGFPFKLLGMYLGIHFIESSALGMAKGFLITSAFSTTIEILLSYRLVNLSFMSLFRRIDKTIFWNAILVLLLGAICIYSTNLFFSTLLVLLLMILFFNRMLKDDILNGIKLIKK